MLPLIGKAIAKAKMSKKDIRNDIAETVDRSYHTPKGSSSEYGVKHNAEPRVGRGYKDRESTSRLLSDELPDPYKKGGGVKKRYADGGIYTADKMRQPPYEPDGESAPPMRTPPRKKPIAAKPVPPKRPPRDDVFREGMTPPRSPDMGSVGMKRGGVVRHGDGIAQRGKTKGRFV